MLKDVKWRYWEEKKHKNSLNYGFNIIKRHINKWDEGQLF